MNDVIDVFKNMYLYIYLHIYPCMCVYICIQTYSCTSKRDTCVHTDTYPHREKDKVLVHRLQMTQLWKVLTEFEVNHYFEVDLSRLSSYNELPKEDHKAFKINKGYIFIKEKTKICEFFLYRGSF